MLTHLIDYPTQKAKQQPRLAGTSKKLYTPFSSWDFEIQEPEVQETYDPRNNMLMHNDLNAYVVDWEMPK